MELIELWPLVVLLADGEWHSGEALGTRLGVSRAAVWKRLQALEQVGLRVDTQRGRGYTLPGGLDLLDAARIHEQLPPALRADMASIEVLLEVPSTNARLLAAKAPAVCLVECQTAGRGRRGRHWFSAIGGSLCLSQSWVFQGGAASLQGLSLAVGVVVAEVLESLGADTIELKWPNDLMRADAKLGGILIELAGDAAGECRAVVGVGLNLALPASAAVDPSWSDVRRAGMHADRSTLAVAVIAAIWTLLRDYGVSGFAGYRSRWEARSAWSGRVVRLSTPASSVSGVLEGVDDSGALLLRTEAGVTAHTGGEISLRLHHA